MKKIKTTQNWTLSKVILVIYINYTQASHLWPLEFLKYITAELLETLFSLEKCMQYIKYVTLKKVLKLASLSKSIHHIVNNIKNKIYTSIYFGLIKWWTDLHFIVYWIIHHRKRSKTQFSTLHPLHWDVLFWLLTTVPFTLDTCRIDI